MKSQKILCGLLAAATATGMLSACGAQTVETPVEETPAIVETVHSAELTAADTGLSSFDDLLIAYMEKSSFQNKNYMVSPLSFRAALALAASGASGETRESLLSAMGFSSLEEVETWYKGLLESIDEFAAELEQEQKMMSQYPEDFGFGTPDRAFSIANSVWHNAGKQGNFSPEYISYVADHFRAVAADLPAAELTERINEWVNKETHGMIPAIVGDLSDIEAILVNALYLRSSWLNTFSEYRTHPGDFTTITGDVVEKDMMQQ